MCGSRLCYLQALSHWARGRVGAADKLACYWPGVHRPLDWHHLTELSTMKRIFTSAPSTVGDTSLPWPLSLWNAANVADKLKMFILLNFN